MGDGATQEHTGEIRFRNIVEKTADGIVVFDVAGRIIFLNPAAEALFGQPRQGLQGQLFDLPFAETTTEIDIVARPGVVAEMRVVEIDWDSQPAYLASLRDITVRKHAQLELEAEQKRLRALFNSTHEAILLVNDDGRFIDVNPAACEMFGYPYQEFLQLTVMDVTPKNDQANAKRTFERFRKQQEQQGEYTILRKDGARIYTLYRAVANIAPGLHMSILQDITLMRTTERQLARRNMALQFLHAIGLDIRARLDMPDLLYHVVKRAVQLIDAADEGGLMLYEPEHNTLRIVEIYGSGKDLIGFSFQPGEDSASTQVIRSQQALITDDYARTSSPLPEILDALPIRAVLQVPLLWNDAVLGILALVSLGPEVRFQADDVRLIEMFAAQAALALENARLYNELTADKQNLEQTVTERTHALDLTTSRMETIVNNSPNAVLQLDPTFNIEVVNPAFTQAFGYTFEDVKGLGAALVVEPDSARSYQNTLEAAKHTQHTYRQEFNARRKDGSIFNAYVAIAPICQGEDVTGLVCSIHDITALKEAARMKDRFITGISHELRTPIASLKLYHDLLKRNPAKSTTYLEHLDRETARLQRIIEDVIFLSQLDQGHIVVHPQPLNLSYLVAHCVEENRSRAKNQNITLRMTIDHGLPAVQGDPHLLEQVLRILLSNALNYTPDRGEVTIHVDTHHDERLTWVRINVSDSGPGITEEECRHIFERFYRGTTATESGRAGTGLGLSIAQEIIEQHDGKIDVTCRDDPGATFTIWLPVTD